MFQSARDAISSHDEHDENTSDWHCNMHCGPFQKFLRFETLPMPGHNCLGFEFVSAQVIWSSGTHILSADPRGCWWAQSQTPSHEKKRSSIDVAHEHLGCCWHVAQVDRHVCQTCACFESWWCSFNLHDQLFSFERTFSEKVCHDSSCVSWCKRSTAWAALHGPIFNLFGKHNLSKHMLKMWLAKGQNDNMLN